MDPFNKGTISNNSARITMGLFIGSPGQILSRFTWELPQTILGYGYSQGANYFGTIQSVNYYDGATVVQSYKDHVWFGTGSGMTLGSFINGSNAIAADPNNWLFQHEYGHYLQSQSSGLFYLSKYAIPSLLSSGDHDLHPAEQDANVRAFSYFHKHLPGYSGWKFWANPIKNYDESKSYDDASNQDALNNGRLGLSWYDYLMGPTIIVPGIINALILNKNQ